MHLRRRTMPRLELVLAASRSMTQLLGLETIVVNRCVSISRFQIPTVRNCERIDEDIRDRSAAKMRDRLHPRLLNRVAAPSPSPSAPLLLGQGHHFEYHLRRHSLAHECRTERHRNGDSCTINPHAVRMGHDYHGLSADSSHGSWHATAAARQGCLNHPTRTLIVPQPRQGNIQN